MKSFLMNQTSRNVEVVRMPKVQQSTGCKNLVGLRLPLLRKEHHLSQHELAVQLQNIGLDIDKNVITRIENQQRFVYDIEVKAIAKLFGVPYDFLIDGVT